MTKLINAGRYQEAIHWGDWALTKLNQSGLSSAQRRLFLTNDWAYARILFGETAGLAERLHEEEVHLENAFSGLANLYRETLGDYFVAIGDPVKALTYYQKNWDTAPRTEAGQNALGMTRALIHQGKLDKALELATRARALMMGEHRTHQQEADLAYFTALALTNPILGLQHFDVIERQSSHQSMDADYLAQQTLYLAWAYLQTDNVTAARKVLRANETALTELGQTGLRLLSGPEHLFRDVWALVEAECSVQHVPVQRHPGAAPTPELAPLLLTFLGRHDVSTGNEPLTLAPQAYEVLALLALHPAGLSGEGLLALLYGDGGNRGTLKTVLSRLRQDISISSRPYKLDSSVQADFLQLETLLREGRVREGLELYAGPLLPASEAPGIVEVREHLEEVLRQAVLASGDAELVFGLAGRLKDDLELWETVASLLDEGDPRLAVVRARVKRVREKWKE